MRFDTTEEYVDFYYALESLLRQVYPKVTLAWMQRNTSQYESDLENIIQLANSDFAEGKKVSPVKTTSTGDLGVAVVPVISRGVLLMAKRKTVKPTEAAWVVVIGYLNQGKVLIVNDSKLGASLEIPGSDINVIYHLFVQDSKSSAKSVK
ncbi:hypothetical protein CH352_05160 [Leptospira hartskeerlii]|uniref:Uncharacterized protein n=1 Tax=Leptospira hartskeerlii TaxID=2023177 RepID=A0A2M9XGZ0_9LEPT|nr:hypothetical protein CH357_03295 [Leptospira hartskeerlii]PJZ35060.1 hypothetical protein CH352_05160 [Leptospira hartskeerlii]